MNRRLLRGMVEPVDGLHGLDVELVLYASRRYLALMIITLPRFTGHEV
jgi:hypothetical protein